MPAMRRVTRAVLPTPSGPGEVGSIRRTFGHRRRSAVGSFRIAYASDVGRRMRIDRSARKAGARPGRRVVHRVEVMSTKIVGTTPIATTTAKAGESAWPGGAARPPSGKETSTPSITQRLAMTAVTQTAASRNHASSSPIVFCPLVALRHTTTMLLVAYRARNRTKVLIG